ncbi:universal stress protein [Leuconostoc litchii]|uniref:Universal stress protein n=1 Tax=Leuconostoc litchii TaxID=1981069 RepID=A0A6P2CQB6_9LACO|nr:universal stress protein [Leuconostoc litchii]TYC47302.1 universal stress protein [Leuconostoc litchii]GMA69295.1 universal stress protein [Leuconostoc litchii]
MAYNNILVAIDGSEVSNTLIKKVVDFAPEAHIDILTVVDTTGGGYFGSIAMNEDVVYQMEQTAEKGLIKAFEYAKDLGHSDVDIHVRFGSPKSVIAREFPKDHKNDLIVIGETGLSRLQRAMAGTVPSFVTQVSKVDVLILRTFE